jgi:O-antigen/teichoic acid export membrane protein
MAVNKFISSSLFLFLTRLVDAAGSWLYWLIISKFTSTFEVGQATSIYSLILLVSTITQVGLEYPILKNSSVQRSHILANTLIIETIITCTSIPFVFFILANINQGSLEKFSWLGSGILILTSITFVSHFVILGILNAKSIFILDTAGTITKFVSGYFFVAMGFGAFGILLSFLIYFLWLSSISLILAYNIFGLQFGSVNIRYIQRILKDGLTNMPSNLSKIIIFSLSIVLLATFGINSSEIGTFYITLMISIVGGSLVTSMAYMVLPASSISKVNLFSRSMRIGLSLTAPIIAGMIASPKFILSFLGPQYTSAEMALFLLSIGILPYSIFTNTISKFNYSGQSRRIVFLGSLQVFIFLLAFFLLVPQYKTLGAAFSILIAFTVSSIPAVSWSARDDTRYVGNSVIAIIVGWAVGYMVNILLSNVFAYQFLSIITSVSVTMAVIVTLKNISTVEIKAILEFVIKR